MTEEKEKGEKRTGWPLRVVTALLLVICAAGVWTAAVLLDKREDNTPVKEISAEMERMAVTDGASLAAAEAAFGACMPVLSVNAVSVSTRNAVWNGLPVRRLTAEYENGVVLSAVRPAEAAPLLTVAGSMPEVSGQQLTVCNMQAVLCSGGNAFCLYFSDGETAWALCMENTDRESFLRLAAGTVPPGQ